MNLNLNLIPYVKKNLKQIMNLNVKQVTKASPDSKDTSLDGRSKI